jgi:hypothetical protein
MALKHCYRFLAELSRHIYRLRLFILLAFLLWLASNNSQVIDAVRSLNLFTSIVAIVSITIVPAVVLSVGIAIGGGVPPTGTICDKLFAALPPALVALLVEFSIARLICAPRKSVWLVLILHFFIFCIWLFILRFLRKYIAPLNPDSLIGIPLQNAIGMSTMEAQTPLSRVNPKAASTCSNWHLIAIVALAFLLQLFVAWTSLIIGTALTLSLLLVAWTLLFSLLSWLSLCLRIHIVSLSCGLAALWAIPAWNQDGEMRQLLAVGGRKTIVDDFTEWIQNRPDKELYPDGYPVFMIAAEGGGIRAAYATALSSRGITRP